MFSRRLSRWRREFLLVAVCLFAVVRIRALFDRRLVSMVTALTLMLIVYSAMNMGGIIFTALVWLNVLSVPLWGLTANLNPLDLARFKSAGISGVMLKPFEPGQLCKRIEQLWLS